MEIYKIHVYPEGEFLCTLVVVLRVVSDNCSINKVACELRLGWSIVNTWIRKMILKGQGNHIASVNTR